MPRLGRAAVLIIVSSLLAACLQSQPPAPAVGFAEASARPLAANRDELLASGGRQLDPSSVRRVVSVMGDHAFLRAIGAAASTRLSLRPDGAVCFEDRPETSCRLLVADGRTYRLFGLDGAPHGTLTPAEG